MHNNVGIGGTSGLPDQIEPAAWAREMDQNLTSAYMGIRCAAPAMRANGGGSILDISSLLAVRFLRRPTSGYSGKAGWKRSPGRGGRQATTTCASTTSASFWDAARP